MKPLALWLVAMLLACCPTDAALASKGEVVIYGWTGYIPQNVLNDFTKETGIKVVYSTYESNEAMFAKVKLLKGAGFDIIVPSTDHVTLLRRDNLLQELDHSRLPNMANLDPRLMNQNYDPGNKYSIPYLWGSTGLAYNKKFLPNGIEGWNDLMKPELKGHILLTDDLRDAFGLALLALGYSSNSTDPEQIREAFDWLVKLKPSARVFDSNRVQQSLASEEVWVSPIWSDNFLAIAEEVEGLVYVFPREGAMLWMESFTIPARASNVENAYTFINYMLRPEVAARCVEEIMGSTPNLKALELIPEDLRNNHVFAPSPEHLKKAEFQVHVGEALPLYGKLWKELKALK